MNQRLKIAVASADHDVDIGREVMGLLLFGSLWKHHKLIDCGNMVAIMIQQSCLVCPQFCGRWLITVPAK